MSLTLKSKCSYPVANCSDGLMPVPKARVKYCCHRGSGSAARNASISSMEKGSIPTYSSRCFLNHRRRRNPLDMQGPVVSRWRLLHAAALW
jgi:hypothetical protein